MRVRLLCCQARTTVQGCSAEVGADVEQTDHTGLNAGEQCEGGSWVALKDAAAQLGISVDTVKRRMQRGELESRRETIPQGFRWLVFVESAKNDAAGSILSDANDNRGVQLPPDSPDIVAALLRQLEGRDQEIARLHETIASLSRAVEHMGQLTATVERASGGTNMTNTDDSTNADADFANEGVTNVTDDAPGSPESDEADESQRGIWARLRRWWKGQTVR